MCRSLAAGGSRGSNGLSAIGRRKFLKAIMGQHVSATVGYLSNITNMNYSQGERRRPVSMNQQHHNQGKRKRYSKKIPKNAKLGTNDLQQITDDVLDLIFDWFPELHERTYFLPPVHMNKLLYKASAVGGKEVQTIQPTPESDWRDDEVMQRTLCCLRALTDSRQEPMVVLLQMQHDNYLNKSCYAAAAAHYPRPSTLPPKLRRGDFDLLFLHRDRGLIVAEIKSVGWRPGGEQDDETVKKKVKQAVEQLNKARTVLTHLTSDLKPSPLITNTLILPNVSSNRLVGLLQDTQLAQDFCACFNATDVEAAVKRCLCSQQMTSMDKPGDVTPYMLQQLTEWWCHLVDFGNSVQGCAPDVYELLVARFCGPASTVQVHCVRPPRLEFRTLGHAVQEVGERMVEFVLFPEQLALLQELEEECVYLTGPPGTGKTLMLILVALQWSRRGHHVHVVSTGTFSEAATHLLYYQVTKTLGETDPEAVSRMHIHLNGNNTQSVKKILANLIDASRSKTSTSDTAQQEEQLSHNVTGQERQLSDISRTQEGQPLNNCTQEEGNACLNTTDQEKQLPSQNINQDGQLSDTTTAKGGQLFLVVDEVGETFPEFFEGLKKNVDDLHIWAASYRKEFRPPSMKEKVLYACLRSTPVVMRRMQTAISFAVSGVDGYEDRRPEYLSPSDGPSELFLIHEDHSSERAMDCFECGQNIARCLQYDLDIGKKPKNATSVKTPSSLQYSDVMIIPDYYQDIEDLGDDDPNDNSRTGGLSPSTTEASSKASGLVRGLRSEEIPTYVVTKQDGEKIKELARAEREEVAVVAWGVSNGLERKVVVSVGQGRKMGEGRISGVLHGASRCVSQLIYVKCPE